MSPLESPCPVVYYFTGRTPFISSSSLLQPLPCYTLPISQGLSQVLVSVSVAGPCRSVPGVPRSDTAVLVLMFVKLCVIYLDLIRAACSWSLCTCCVPLCSPVDLRCYFVFHMLLRQHLLKRLCDTFISRSEIIVAGEVFSDFCFPFLLRYAFLRFVNLSFFANSRQFRGFRNNIYSTVHTSFIFCSDYFTNTLIHVILAAVRHNFVFFSLQ
jgi:hypothetical protein